MLEYLKNRPMLLCGILCSVYAIVGYYFSSALYFIGIGIALVLGMMILIKARPTLIFVVALSAVMLLNLNLTHNKIAKLSNYNNTEITAKLTVCDITYESYDYSVADAEIIECKELPNGTKISMFYSDVDLKLGQMLTADLKLEAVPNDKYRKDSYSRGIYLTADASNIVICRGEEDLVLKSVGRVRNYIKDALFSNMGYEEAATLCALIFGDRSYFTDEFYGSVKVAGVSHVMVVSGMHLSILVLFFTSIIERKIYNRYFKALCIVAVVLLLTTLCGFTMSMLRAGVTYIIMAAALILKRQSIPENTLGAAVALILIFSPFAVFSIAFQLSVLSTFGILAVALPVTKYVNEKSFMKLKPLRGIVSSIIMTISALLLTLPVAIKTFGSLSTLSVITNLLISPVVTAELWISVTALMINLISPYLARFIFKLNEILTVYINFIINKFGELEFSVVEAPEYCWIFAVLLIIIIFWLLFACKKRLDMIKLEKIRKKIIEERGNGLKWRQFLKKL